MPRPSMFAAALALGARLAWAQEPETEAELGELMQILNEETEVATRTRMNGDFVPGIVTVLHGDDLEALGVEAVWEALGLVPGLQAVRGPDGIPAVVVRGVDFPFNSGNLKVLVDSVPLSRENAGLHGIVLLTPIQQVERIEVIRGPGSVVHGDFAFLGLVNVITRAKGSRVWARGGGDDALSAGAALAFRPGGWELSLGAAGWRSTDAPVPDPYEIEESRAFASLGARRGGFSLTGLAIARDADPANVASRVVSAGAGTQEHLALEGRYTRKVGATEASGRVSLRNNDYSTLLDFEGEVLELGLDFSGTAAKRHHWLAGAAYHRSSIDRATFRFPPPPGSDVPQEVALLLRGEHREVWSVLLQDRTELSDALAATAGVRFDHDKDVGSRFTPRVALVWRLSDRHVLKAQHAEGFRPPTFFELYASGRPAEGLDFEVNATTEINYVFRRPRAVARATLFRTRMRDMIFPDRREVGSFSNGRSARADGVELEWEQQVGSRLRLIANASYVDEEDDRNPRGTFVRSPATAAWMGNVAAILRPTARTALTARWNHVGERLLPAPLPGWDLLDVSGAVEDVLHRGLSLRAGVKNVLDDDVVHVLSLPMQVRTLAFPGRTAWVQLAWDRR